MVEWLLSGGRHCSVVFWLFIHEKVSGGSSCLLDDAFNAFHKGICFDASCSFVNGSGTCVLKSEAIPVAAFFEVRAGNAFLGLMAVFQAFLVAFGTSSFRVHGASLVLFLEKQRATKVRRPLFEPID
jgi:hypothetical protein